MLGLAGSKHWAEDSIYKLLADQKHHTFLEIRDFIINDTGRSITNCNLSTVLHRLKARNQNIVSYRYGYFKLQK